MVQDTLVTAFTVSGSVAIPLSEVPLTLLLQKVFSFHCPQLYTQPQAIEQIEIMNSLSYSQKF